MDLNSPTLTHQTKEDEDMEELDDLEDEKKKSGSSKFEQI
jgi:hypothetical protein